MKFFRMPWPMPKKSPIGHSTLGSRQPSQYISSTSRRGYACGSGFAPAPSVIQMCLTQPGPSISAIVAGRLFDQRVESEQIVLEIHSTGTIIPGQCMRHRPGGAIVGGHHRGEDRGFIQRDSV